MAAVTMGAAACGTPQDRTAADAGVADAPGTVTAAAPAATDADGDRGTTLVVGSVSDDAEEEAGVFQPFADHLAGTLVDAGITRGAVVVAGSVEEMAELLRAGEVDLYIDSMYGVTTVAESGAGVPVLRRWKDGSASYHSVVVVRRDSGIATVDGLRGATVAFENPDSTDGWFLPAATLLEAGLPLSALDGTGGTGSTDGTDGTAGTAVPADAAGYVFSGDDENTVYQVLEGKVDAGALSAEDLEENSGDRADELVTLVRTAEVPRHGVVLRAGLDPALVPALTSALTTMHDDARGRAVLADFDDTARFDALTPESVDLFLRMSARLRDGT